MEHLSRVRPKARSDGLLSEQVGDEIVVYDGRRQEAHSLNRAASIVWRHSDGTRTVPQLAGVLGKELGIEANESLVEYALDRLADARLLEKNSVTRRDAMRRISLAGAAAFALPVVLSIIAPTSAMAASGPSLPPDPGPD